LAIKVSIVTVTYNSGKYLLGCIESIKSQNIILEHILIDGGSTDETIKMVQQYKDHFSYISSEPDHGIYDAMNKGILLATGDVIGLLNADDIYQDENVLQRVEEVFSDPTVDACYGDLVYVDSKDTSKVVRYWKSGTYDVNKFYWGWMPPHPTFFVRRSVYEKYGLFNLDLGSAADYEIMLRFLLKHRIRAEYIPEVLVRMRSGGVSNATIKNRLKANKMDRLAWKLNGLRPYPWTLYFKPLRKVLQWFIK